MSGSKGEGADVLVGCECFEFSCCVGVVVFPSNELGGVGCMSLGIAVERFDHSEFDVCSILNLRVRKGLIINLTH